MEAEKVREVVRKGYGRIAQQEGSRCEPECCGSADRAEGISKQIGYREEDLQAAPEGANLGLGCGNPVALASLREGETVLDLGSGAGFDCFLAADRVGEGGRVIGVDMTAEMIEKARANARKGRYTHVEFRLGEIENLPCADRSVDVVISNCVINLSPDKPRVFEEAFRALKPGGRLMVSDIVLLKELPDVVKNSVEAYVGCLAGAVMKDEYVAAIERAGFREVRIVDETTFPMECMANDPTAQAILDDMEVPPEALRAVGGSVASVKVEGKKP